MWRRRHHDEPQDPDSAGRSSDDWLNKGRLYEQDHRVPSAIKAYERVIKLRGPESMQASLSLRRLRG